MRLVQTARAVSLKRGDLVSSYTFTVKPGMNTPEPSRQVRSGRDIHAFSAPAGAFTGDLYFIEERHDGVWFAVGDVSGKGLDSAIFMKMVHEELDYRVKREDLSVTCLVSCIHDLLSVELPANKFVSLVAGHLGVDGRLELVNAGHTSPLVVRSDGSIEIITSTGPVAGILPGARWCSRDLHLGRGEALILYSDGVTEANSPAGEELELTGLEQIVTMIPKDSATGIVNGIRAGVDAHRAGRPADDDVTIVAIMSRG